MTVSVTGESALFRKLYIMRKNTGEVSPALIKAMQVSAVLLESQAKLNIRRNKMIDTGNLLGSIRGQFSIAGKSVMVRVSSDTPYSKIHEEGGRFTPQMRKAMFWRLREEGRMREGYTPKGVAPGASGNFRERPYMQPAYDMYKKKIVDLVRAAILGEK